MEGKREEASESWCHQTGQGQFESRRQKGERVILKEWSFCSLHPLRCGFFSLTCSVGIALLVSGFLSEGVVLYVVVDLGCLGKEVSSRNSYIAILNLKIPRTYFLFDFLDLRK